MMNPITQYMIDNTCSLEAVAERAQLSYSSVYTYANATPNRARKMSLETCRKFQSIGMDFLPFAFEESAQQN